MKKIFYILVSAIVALGAVACENEGLENINPNVGNGEGLSFVATIDAESRVALDGTVNSWELDDEVVINGYTFTCINEEKGIFSCTMDNVRKDLIGKGTFTATYSNNGDGKVDSSAGAKGAVLTATGSFTETDGVVKANGFNFTLTSALLKFTTTEEVVLAGEGLFNNAKDSYTGTDVLVAINAVESTLSYSIGSVQCKSLTKNFEPGKIYNLGELFGPSDWETSNGVRLLKTATPDLFVAKNITMTSNNFCLKNVNLDWGAVGAKMGLVTAATKSANTAIGVYCADWAGDITISNATKTAYDIYFDKANSRVYVVTPGKDISTIAKPTHSSSYNIGGSMNNWGSTDAKYKFTYAGDNVWYLVITFAANDQFKVKLNNAWTTSYGYSKIQNNVGKSLFSSPSDDNAKVNAAGTYEIWVIPSHTDAPLYIIKK